MAVQILCKGISPTLFHRLQPILMFSAEKAPFLVRFKVTTLGVTKVEEVALNAYKEFVNDEKPVSTCSQKGHSRQLSKPKANPHSEIDQEKLQG